MTYAPARTTSNDATVALLLSIGAWLLLPIVLAMVSLVFASRASSAIEGSGGSLEGRGMVTAARIVSWMNIALFLVLLAVAVVVLVVFDRNFASGSALRV